MRSVLSPHNDGCRRVIVGFSGGLDGQPFQTTSHVASKLLIQRGAYVERRGTRIGNWLTQDQANDLLNAPDPRCLGNETGFE